MANPSTQITPTVSVAGAHTFRRFPNFSVRSINPNTTVRSRRIVYSSRVVSKGVCYTDNTRVHKANALPRTQCLCREPQLRGHRLVSDNDLIFDHDFILDHDLSLATNLFLTTILSLTAILSSTAILYLTAILSLTTFLSLTTILS